MNNWTRLQEQARYYKDQYPPGTRLKLISMGEDIHRVPDNTRGTVRCVDDIGTVHCSFDNGRSLGLVPGEDSFRALTAEELDQHVHKTIGIGGLLEQDHEHQTHCQGIGDVGQEVNRLEELAQLLDGA